MNYGIVLSTVSRDSLSSISPSRQARPQRQSGGKQAQLHSVGHRSFGPSYGCSHRYRHVVCQPNLWVCQTPGTTVCHQAGNHHNAPHPEGQIPVHTGTRMGQTPADAFHMRMDCGRKKHGRLLISCLCSIQDHCWSCCLCIATTARGLAHLCQGNCRG